MTKQFWDRVWINGNLATLTEDNDYSIINNGAIAVRNGKIAWLGKVKDIGDDINKLTTEIIDVNGKWITPGLIDSHTHLVYGGNRANEFNMRLQGKTYAEIAQAGGGIKSTVAATRQLDATNLYEQSAKRLKAIISEGVTTLEIKSGYGLDLETELKMLQVAKQLGKDFPVTIRTTFLGAHTIPEEYKDRADDYIEFIINQVLPQAHSQGLVDAVDGFCESIAFSPAQIARVFDKANDLNIPVKLHAEQLTQQGGAALAASYHALSADHLEYVDEKQVAAMAKAGTAAVLLPGAYYYLQEELKPPIDLFREYKVPMVVATDCNPGSSPVTSLLLIMNMACVLFKFTPLESLQAVTKNAALALGLEKNYGTLAIDKMADFVVWDIQHPQDLVYQIGYNPVSQIIKHGQIN